MLNTIYGHKYPASRPQLTFKAKQVILLMKIIEVLEAVWWPFDNFGQLMSLLRFWKEGGEGDGV